MFSIVGRFLALASAILAISNANALAADDHILPRLVVVGGSAGSSSLSATAGEVVYRLEVTATQTARTLAPLRGEVSYAGRPVPLQLETGTVLYRADAMMRRQQTLYCSCEPQSVDGAVRTFGRACAADENSDGEFERLWFLPGAATFDGGFAFQSSQALPRGATYEATSAQSAPTMTLALVYQPLGLRNYQRSSDFRLMAQQNNQLMRLGFEFYRSDFSRADPPQVEFVGIRLEVSTDNDGVLHYRVLEAPTLGSTIEQPFPALVPARPR